jgi:hypothetical protein
MVVLVCALTAAVPVLAFAPPGGSPANQGSPFNASDSTPSCPPTTPNLNNPTAAAAPVAVTCTETGGAKPVTVNWVSDTLSGNATDNAWGQGDKSDCFLAKAGGVAGACVTQVFGIGASKTDLQYHGIGLEKGTGPQATHDYLYSGIKRLQAGGITSSNANYNIEVNQLLAAYQPAAPICPLVAPNTGGCNIWRSPGDLTFMTDWGGNQSSCDVPTPAICAYVWIDFSAGTGKTPSPAGSTCFNAQAAPCWGILPGGSAKLSDNATLAAGSINSSAAVQPSTFSEISVDLTASGLIPEGTCETFQNVWAHSRSSSSFSAELKDFIFGNITLSTCSTTTTVLHQRTDSTGTTDVSPANNGLEISVAPGAWVNDIATVTTGATGNVNFRYYGTLAACEADTAHAAGTNVSSNAVSSGSATSTAVQFNTTGTFWWRAFYLGDGLAPSASPCDETVTVRQNTTTSTVLHERTSSAGTTDVTPANNGGSITVKTGVWVNDIASVVPSAATGTVSFKYYPSLADCTADTNGTAAGSGISVSSGSATSSTLQFNTAGTFYWLATFTGSGSFNGSSSVCGDEVLTVRQDTTTSTVLHQRTNSTGDTDVNPANNGGSIAVPVGAWVNDVASVLPSAATGTVSFKYYPSVADCTADTNGTAAGSGISLSSGSATSSTLQFNTVGSFYWRAFFSATGLNNGSNSVCGDEILTVNPVNTSISTAPWYYPNDKATISAPNGGGNLAGSITFKLYNNATNCAANGATGLLYSEAAQNVAGAGPLDFNTANTSVKVSTTTTVYWNVTYTSTNPSQIGRNSVCIETINATLTGDTGGSIGNTP